jgi:hypothetical protein
MVPAREVFELRCWARAYLFASCAMPLHEAVDELQHAAVENGLVLSIGQDTVQAMIAAAFGGIPE